MVELSHGLWIQEHLWVQTKESGLMKLAFTASQLKLYQLIRAQQKAGKPVRVIAVKPRQIRFTTLIQAIFFEDLFRNSNKNALVVANQEDVAKNILSMSKRFYENLDPRLKAMRPLEYNTKTEIKYEHPHSSRQLVITAKRGDMGGKSYTFQNVHLSECADYYQVCDPSLLYATITAAVPMESSNTMIIMESTASGQDPFFFAKANAARNGDLPGWEMLFIPWFEESDYTIKVTDEFKPTYEEKELAKEFNLTHGQLAWRRNKLIVDCSNNLTLFQRYYPSTFDEAFLSTSQTLFDANICNRKIKECERHPPLFRCEFELDMSGPRWKYHKRPLGQWKIWEEPIPGVKYTIGADPSRYASHANASAAHVIRGDKMTVVASFHGAIENHEFAHQLYAIGLYYNTALLVPENNIPVLCYELNTHLQYPNLYYYTTGEEYGMSKSKRFDRPGINMNGKSRTVGIERLLKIYTDVLVCWDPEFWGELIHFKQSSYATIIKNLGTGTKTETTRNKFAAESTIFSDDSIMALVCALYVIDESQIVHIREEKSLSFHEQRYKIIQDRIADRYKHRPIRRISFGSSIR